MQATNTTMKATDTQFPSLARAVLRTVGRDSIEDLARHGADAGWPGITYTADTVSFYRRHKKDILALAASMADDFGEDMLTMIAGFNCLKSSKLTPSEIGEALFSGRGECADVIQNAMTWFAAEEMARQLCPGCLTLKRSKPTAI